MAGNAHEEPNLVPLLDLVLQLVMFFMMCANFVMAQVDKNIELPVAQSAKPMAEAQGTDVLFLNVNREGFLQVVGRPKPMTSDEEVAAYLRGAYEDGQRRAGEEARKAGLDPAQAKVETLVIVRADKEADYKSIYRIMRKCSDVGLRRIQLRARIGG